MINKRRVRRIKNFIYFILFLIFLLPAIIAILLLFKMWNLESKLEEVAQQQPPVLSTQQGGLAGNASEGTGTAFLPESIPESSIPDGITDSDDSAILDADLISGGGALPADSSEGTNGRQPDGSEMPTSNDNHRPESDDNGPGESIRVESPQTGLPQ